MSKASKIKRQIANRKYRVFADLMMAWNHGPRPTPGL